MAGYELDPAAFREHVLNADWLEAHLVQRAERGKAVAEGIAPDAPPIGEGYKQSFTVEHGKNGPPGAGEPNRAWAMLVNDDDAAVYVEFGNGHPGTAQHVMQRAKDSM